MYNLFNDGENYVTDLWWIRNNNALLRDLLVWGLRYFINLNIRKNVLLKIVTNGLISYMLNYRCYLIY
jgi:hypothetical protein